METNKQKLRDNLSAEFRDDRFQDKQLDGCENVADDHAIGFVNWLTSEKSKYSVMYGNQEKRFADFDNDYTIAELLEIYKSQTS